MTVLIYYGNDHPSNYVGCRVVTTIGASGDYKQEYFALSQYAKAKAKDDEWRALAAQVKKERRLQKQKKRWQIAGGLNASILVRNERKGSHTYQYIVPVFLVRLPASKGVKLFPIGGKFSFDQAFTVAVDFFCQSYQFDDEQRLLLIGRKPSKDIFTCDLYRELIKNGHRIELASLNEKLTSGGIEDKAD